MGKVFVIFVLLFLLEGCLLQKERETLILATTTSTYDSGLLDYLLPEFHERCNCEVQVISVGSGQALKLAERGDVDVVLVHSPKAEKEFVKSGLGVNRRCVMYNDFVVLGPEYDPAKVKGMDSIVEAFQKIAENHVEFVSRGDDSGTHKKELSIWKASGVEPAGEWYLEIGEGMGETIRFADEKLAYTLADRGTYISLMDNISIIVLVEGDKLLLNPYSVIAVKSSVNYELALDFIEWLMSEETQERIEDFEKNGEKLFHPLFGDCIGGREWVQFLKV
ncbi:MAG: substrate-binding domain-containing protein [Candidatus Methanofastidiosia archaeon]